MYMENDAAASSNSSRRPQGGDVSNQQMVASIIDIDPYFKKIYNFFLSRFGKLPASIPRQVVNLDNKGGYKGTTFEPSKVPFVKLIPKYYEDNFDRVFAGGGGGGGGGGGDSDDESDDPEDTTKNREFLKTLFENHTMDVKSELQVNMVEKAQKTLKALTKYTEFQKTSGNAIQNVVFDEDDLINVEKSTDELLSKGRILGTDKEVFPTETPQEMEDEPKDDKKSKKGAKSKKHPDTPFDTFNKCQKELFDIVKEYLEFEAKGYYDNNENLKNYCLFKAKKLHEYSIPVSSVMTQKKGVVLKQRDPRLGTVPWLKSMTPYHTIPPDTYKIDTTDLLNAQKPAGELLFSNVEKFEKGSLFMVSCSLNQHFEYEQLTKSNQSRTYEGSTRGIYTTGVANATQLLEIINVFEETPGKDPAIDNLSKVLNLRKAELIRIRSDIILGKARKKQSKIYKGTDQIKKTQADKEVLEATQDVQATKTAYEDADRQRSDDDISNVFFFHNQDQDHLEKYLMSLLLLCGGVSVTDIEFMNTYSRASSAQTDVKLKYMSDTPSFVICWFIYQDRLYVLKIRVSFQSFGRDLQKIMNQSFFPDEPTSLKDSMIFYRDRFAGHEFSDIPKIKETLLFLLFSTSKDKPLSHLRDFPLYPPRLAYTSEQGVSKQFLKITAQAAPAFGLSAAAPASGGLVPAFGLPAAAPASGGLVPAFGLPAFGGPAAAPASGGLVPAFGRLGKGAMVTDPKNNRMIGGAIADVPPANDPNCNCDVEKTITIKLCWAYLIEVFFILDKLHDCGTSRLKDAGYASDVIKPIHASLVGRIIVKLNDILIGPNDGPEAHQPGVPDGGDQDVRFIRTLCQRLLVYFKSRFSSGTYEPDILNIVLRTLKEFYGGLESRSEDFVLSLIKDLKGMVVNNAVMGKIPTNFPVTFLNQTGEADLLKPVVGVTVATLTDGGSDPEPNPVVLLPKNIHVMIEGKAEPYMKICYKNDIDFTNIATMTEQEIIDMFEEYMTVCIRDIRNGIWHSYHMNPFHKKHNKTILSSEIGSNFFGGAYPFTDEKAFCDFFQHFLCLVATGIEDICFSVYQNDVMSSLFHMLTMLAICESGMIDHTAVKSITAVMYCSSRKFVFKIVQNPGKPRRWDCECTCVTQCLDPAYVELPGGDELRPSGGGGGGGGSSNHYADQGFRPSSFTSYVGAAGSSAFMGGSLNVKKRTYRKKNSIKIKFRKHKTRKMKEIKGYKKQIGGLPFQRDHVNDTDREVFFYMLTERQPRLWMLALMFRHYVKEGLTTKTLEQFIEAYEASFYKICKPNGLGLPFIFQEFDPEDIYDKGFLDFQFLSLSMGKKTVQDIYTSLNNINTMLEREFLRETFIVQNIHYLNRVETQAAAEVAEAETEADAKAAADARDKLVDTIVNQIIISLNTNVAEGIEISPDMDIVLGTSVAYLQQDGTETIKNAKSELAYLREKKIEQLKPFLDKIDHEIEDNEEFIEEHYPEPTYDQYQFEGYKYTRMNTERLYAFFKEAYEKISSMDEEDIAEKALKPAVAVGQSRAFQSSAMQPRPANGSKSQPKFPPSAAQPPAFVVPIQGPLRNSGRPRPPQPKRSENNFFSGAFGETSSGSESENNSDTVTKPGLSMVNAGVGEEKPKLPSRGRSHAKGKRKKGEGKNSKSPRQTPTRTPSRTRSPFSKRNTKKLRKSPKPGSKPMIDQ
jgi:hypothetical protein